MADVNPFEQPPVYKSDQVILISELVAVGQALVDHHNESPWYAWRQRFAARAGLQVINEILQWVADGRPKENS